MREVTTEETPAGGAGEGEEFPVRLTWKEKRHYPDCPPSVPWAAVAPFAARAQTNHRQSLSALAYYGGLSPTCLWAVLHDVTQDGYRSPCSMSEAIAYLKTVARTPSPAAPPAH